MPDISVKTLAVAVQAIDIEIRRLRSLGSADIVPGDVERLLQYELAGDELEDAYAEAARAVTNLPPYADLARRDR